MGERPAVLVIDAQNYMLGPPPGSSHEYPSACGAPAIAAISRLVPLLRDARAFGVPVIYTRFELRRDGADIGVYGRTRTVVASDCVFDRIDLAHRVSLFDLDRQYADVVDSEVVAKHFGSLRR